MDNKKNNELITEYGNFAYGIAKLYRNKGLDWEDLKQEAILGLLKAGEHYDPDKNVQFTTYATYWIKKQILAALKSNSFSYTEEIKENIGADNLPDKITDTNSSNYEPAFVPISPNSIGFDFPEVMPALERTILQLSFGEGKSLKEIAHILQMSVERVTQQKRKALRRLKSLYPKE